MNKVLINVLLFFLITISIYAEDSTKITSDGKLVLDYKQKVANFFDNVLVENADGTLKSDKLIVFFDSNGNSIEKMIAIGKVVIDQKEHKALAERAEYFSQKNKIILTGNPIIKKGENFYSADSIIIDLTLNKVYFEPSAKIIVKKESGSPF